MAGPSSLTVKIDPARADALRDRFRDAGWRFDATPPDYAIWGARLPHVRAVLYSSGKMVLQGRDAAHAAEEFLGQAPAAGAPSRAIRVPTAGSDEAGKGDFLGPLVVAATLVKPGQEGWIAELGIRDSKTMSDLQVFEAAIVVRQTLPHAVLSLAPPKYAEMHAAMGANLNRLLAWAHGQVLETLLARPDAAGAVLVVVDQFAKGSLMRNSLGPRAKALALEERPRAEDNAAVAAASVLARDGFLAGLRTLGVEVGVTLAKGAGPPADAAARRVLAKGGVALLARVAKMHFKNAEKVGAR